MREIEQDTTFESLQLLTLGIIMTVTELIIQFFNIFFMYQVYKLTYFPSL